MNCFTLASLLALVCVIACPVDAQDADEIIIALPKDCDWYKQDYKHGTIHNLKPCYSFMCDNGIWKPHKINSRCAHCWAYDDPHIKPFDNPMHYEMQRFCQYIMVEILPDNTFPTSQVATPWYGWAVKAGVAAHFGECMTSSTSVSCVSITTFKNSQSRIKFRHKPSWTSSVHFHVIGSAYFGYSDSLTEGVVTEVQHPLDTEAILIWSECHGCNPGKPNCIRAVGWEFVVLICPWSLDIWTYPKFMDLVGGLCGNYNGLIPDDFETSDGVIKGVGNPIVDADFSNSWRTKEQLFKFCECDKWGCCKPKEPPECEYETIWEEWCYGLLLKFPQIYMDEIKFESLMERCVCDLCAASQVGPKQVEEMKKTEKGIAAVMNDLIIEEQKKEPVGIPEEEIAAGEIAPAEKTPAEK